MTLATANSARNTAEMTGGEAIVRALVANGVDTLFGLPGAQMYPFFDALHRHSDAIRTVGARHEQACAYMAFGHARSTGQPGVFSVVPGPGVLNTFAALATAAGCCAPVLCVTGQVPTAFIGKGRGHLHELPDQRATLRQVCKWAERIESVADAPAIVDEAFRQMLSGRPGPVAIEMAWDVMAAKGEVEILPRATIPAAPPPDREAIAKTADLLAGAKHPMLFLGSGAQGAVAEVRALCEMLGMPAVAFRGGRGIVPESSTLGLSCYAGFLAWPEVDVALGVGTRMELPYMRWSNMMTLMDAPQAPPHIIRMDIDPEEMTRLRPHTAVVADAAAGLRALIEALRERGVTRKDISWTAPAKAEASREITSVKPHIDYLNVIRAALLDDGFFVEELCQAGFTSYFGYDVRAPRTYVSAGFQGTLGFGFMTALGVKAANPDRPVVSIAGDGGFLFGVQELATAAQYGLGVVVIVFNNGAYGNVLRDQDMRFGGRVIGAELTNPDFMTLAKAFGIAGHRVDSPEALSRVLPDALAADRPTLIEVTVDRASEVIPWRFVHPQR